MDSIYANNLNNVSLSKGISKESLIDKANESPRDYLLLLLAKVDMKRSKVKQARKNYYH